MSINAVVLSKSTKEYRRRKPEYGPYYQCIEDYYKQFKRSYDRSFSKKYGYLRPKINTYSDDFDEYIRDDYIDYDHVC